VRKLDISEKNTKERENSKRAKRGGFPRRGRVLKLQGNVKAGAERKTKRKGAGVNTPRVE